MKPSQAVVFACAVLALAGCGGGATATLPIAPVTPTAPTVSSTLPAANAASVATSSAVSATFSQNLNASTLQPSTLSVNGPNGSLAGVATFNPATFTLTLTPQSPLTSNTQYTATVSTGPTNTSGNPLAAAVTWTFTTATVPTSAATTAYLDFSSSQQTIRGFGGSTAWMPQMPTAQVNALYGNTNAQQLGLSILRVRIDPGGSAYWGPEIGNALEAQALGAIVFATPWTPPANLKSNSSTVGGTLNPSSYAAYATYLQSFVTAMSNAGVNLYGISMQNEPDANVSYESCGWTGATMDAWVAANASTLTSKFIMPEAEGFSSSFSDPALNDTSAVGHIDIVAGHLYSGGIYSYLNASGRGKDVWMTEHYLTPSGAEPAIADAVAAAKEVHDSLTIGNYNAYLWWWVADWNPGGGVTNYGLTDTSNNPTYYGYALAQYAKFIRPGYVRVSATYSPNPNIYVSAYKGSGHQVIVALNLGNSPVSQSFSLNQGPATLTPWQTSPAGPMTQLPAVPIANGAFTANLPAQSITTFVN